MQTIMDPARVAMVKKFVKVFEDYVGQEKSRITMLDCMYEFTTAGKEKTPFHQDMCTQSLGMICNLGNTVSGTQFLKYPGISLAAMPTLAEIKAFLKDKRETTELKDPPTL